ncbi:TPA: hypothetical protein ACUJK1_001028 [Streptococcus agalactiae]|uniref:hypothetical protein n=1 Tax=Streptococcus agalactiae TaxID=1311 RepID=UPI0005A5F846|nr:hypothetical protein [Streptococcus agalactiae]HEN2245541.1 hypothetical protein [Streptococcus agalactiae]HEN3160620.1 hypothetical protein [Streptococcus agalactiae]HEN3166966.1 hypothetical protein [Streptococcus agalactiae]HEN3213671.1 hypothetical protein [Streptococcus agalactiae]HEN5752760.1 hypothetical protein [Streptococcus agalactiae]
MIIPDIYVLYNELKRLIRSEGLTLEKAIKKLVKKYDLPKSRVDELKRYYKREITHEDFSENLKKLQNIGLEL